MDLVILPEVVSLYKHPGGSEAGPRAFSRGADPSSSWQWVTSPSIPVFPHRSPYPSRLPGPLGSGKGTGRMGFQRAFDGTPETWEGHRS